MASDLGLEEGRDYVHVCLGTDFPKLIESLSNATTPPPGVPRCDVGASSITETSMRRQAGIEFSQATQRDKLAVLVDGKVQTGGPWAFFQPLHLSVWLSMLATILVVPFFVFFCEYVLSNRCGPCPLGPHQCVLSACAPHVQTRSFRARRAALKPLLSKAWRPATSNLRTPLLEGAPAQ